jgi:hypothetical protein
MLHHWPKVLLLSVNVIAPCLWHRHIEAGDLGSRMYDAWLGHRIQHGQAPGLLVAAHWQNILFDSLLIGLGSVFSLTASEKIAGSLSRMEAEVERLVHTLPPGQRVLESISTESSWRAYIAAHEGLPH